MQCILLKVAFFLAFSIHILASISPNITEVVSESQSLSSVASHSQSGLAQSVRVARIAQSHRTVSPGRSHRPVASPSRIAQSHRPVSPFFSRLAQSVAESHRSVAESHRPFLHDTVAFPCNITAIAQIMGWSTQYLIVVRIDVTLIIISVALTRIALYTGL
jgi:hypothetical protein